MKTKSKKTKPAPKFQKIPKLDKSYRLPLLWKPEDGVTASMLNKFLDCRHQCYLSYMQGWSSKDVSNPITFGDLFHQLLSNLLQGAGSKQPTEEELEAILKRVKKEHLNGTGPMLPREEEEFIKTIGTLRTMFFCYVDYWWGRDQKIEWIEREKIFGSGSGIEYQFGSHDSIIINGRRDGIFSKPYKGKKLTILHETKTKGQIDHDGIRMGLPWNIQTGLYAIASEIETFKPINGVQYDMVQRPGLRQGKNETLEAFLKRQHDEVKAQPEKYFHRLEYIFDAGDLERFKAQVLNPVLRQFVEWYDSIACEKDPFNSPEHFINPNAFWSRTQAAWLHSDKFQMIALGKYDDMVRREVAHPELQDD